ncbi:fimbrial protein, partial [Escherichia coli]
DRNRSHWSTSKTPSYTKSVSWQHHPNMRPVKLNDLHAGMQWIPLVPEQNNILPYSARLKSTQKSVNPGLVRASATFTLEFQ